MKKEILIYLVIIFILGFLGVVGYFAWKNKTSADTSTTPTKSDTSMTTSTKPTKTEPSYPKIESFQVPILMYHYVRDASSESDLGKNLSVWPDNFDAQIKGLVDDSYITIKIADLADPEKKALSKIAYDKKKPIVLTFDDGYQDAYTNALPVLQKYDMFGTFYIIRDYIGKAEYMTQGQIDELENAGMEIGSHSLSHPNLTTLSEADQKSQIYDSKGKATSFCYPAGKYDEITTNLVEGAGYTTAVTTNIGIATEKSDMFELPRVRVEDGSAQVLLDKISYAFEYGKN